MNDYVAKPIRAEELVAALKRAKPLSTDGAGREDGDVKLDAAALGNLRDLGGDDFLGEVIDAFLGDAPELIATLRRSLEEAEHRGAAAVGAHAEVERRNARRRGVRGAVPHARAARQGRRARRRLGARGPDRA